MKNTITVNKEKLAVELAQHRIAFMQVSGLLTEEEIIYYGKNNEPIYTPAIMIVGNALYEHFMGLIGAHEIIINNEQ